MPPAVAIIAGVATIGVGTAMGLGFLVKIGAGLLLTGVAGAIQSNASDSTVETDGRTQMIRQPITPHRVVYGQVRVSGPITFVHTSAQPAGKANTQLQLLLTLAAHECEELGEIQFDEEVVPVPADPTPTGRWASNAAIYRSRGTVADDTALGNGLRAQATDTLWSPEHKQTGCAKIAVVFFYDPDLFPSSLPKVSVITKGRKVYDPRTAQDYDDPDTWTYSNNAALCLLDYLIGYQFNSDSERIPIGLGANLDSIDTDSFIAAANVCDEAVPLQGGGTEPRYTCNGIITTSERPKDVLGKLLTAMHGKLIRSGGKWTLYPGAYITPTLTLTDDDLEGPIKVVTRLGRRELFNSIKGVYIEPTQAWQPTDLPPLESATFLAEDQGEKLWRDISLPFTTSPSMGQRLMKIDLLQARQQITVGLTCKLTAFRVLGGDTVMLTIPRYGWTSKVFDVKHWNFNVRGADEAPSLGVDLLLRETASTVYDWDSSEEDPVDPAPDTEFPDATTVEPPGAPNVTEELYTTLDGVTVKAKAVLDWAASPDAFLDEYQVEWKLSSLGTWTVAGRTDTETFEILDVGPGTYDFRVKALNVLGVSSPYAVTPNVVFLGVSAVPVNVTGLTLSKMGGLAVLRWNLATDLDVRVGGQVLIRHDQDQTTPLWEESVSIGDFIGGQETVALLPLKPGTYMLKFQDQSGEESDAAATVGTDGATVLEYGNLSSISEHPGFTGTPKVNVVAAAGILKLDGMGLWDDIPDVDALADVDSYGGIYSSGTYDFNLGLDSGSVTRVRLRTLLTVTIENVLDLIDERIALIDTWLDFDGTSGATGMDCQIWVRATDDDPAGTPTWGPYERLDLAEFENRAYDFQARLFSGDPAYNILVSEMTVEKEELV